MKFFLAISSLLFGFAVAGDHTFCVKYTKAVFGEDTADNELALITAVVNRAILGDADSSIPGILAPEGGLAPFFDGSISTTNRGDSPVAINFLDGAASLPELTGSTGVLLNHLYQFFGALLGCTTAGYPPYTGNPDMMRVHKFMGITQEMNDFFITQVGLSASSFGVTDDDVMAVAAVLDDTFNTRCPPPIMANAGFPDFLVGTNPSICQAASCPQDENSPCANTTAPTKAVTMAPTMSPESAAPTSDSQTFCVKYTKTVFGEDTADNELALITAVVNRAILGDADSSIPGILAPEGGLAPFFDGSISTTNRGDSPVAINFLDGAASLPELTGSTGVLLNHLYQFFGALLGCTTARYPPYTGNPDMMRVHKFMGITQEMNDFFITQVGLSASSFGVTDDDVMAVAAVLDDTFNTRCPPPIMANAGFPDFLVGTNPSICQATSCPQDENSPCANTTAPTKAVTMAPTMSPESAALTGGTGVIVDSDSQTVGSSSGAGSIVYAQTFVFIVAGMVYSLI